MFLFTGMTPSFNNLVIDGYICYLHKAKLSSPNNQRRGLTIFYRNKYRFLFAKVYASNQYDIVWARLVTGSENIHFCFFYAPGSHHPLPVRKNFYDIFKKKFTEFAALGKVYLIGDTNARLGSVLNDKNLKGQVISNPNKQLFLEFLEYSGLTILNSKYCRGMPTYEIPKKKRSIIDLGLTNAPETVLDFEIESKPLGVNSQTCHKALTAKISLIPKLKDSTPPPRRIKFGRLTHKKRNKIVLGVTNSIIELNNSMSSPDYFLLVELFLKAKRLILGVRSNNRKISSTSPAMRKIQQRFCNAISTMVRDKTDFSIFIVNYLEKVLSSRYNIEIDLKLNVWLKKMSVLDFHNRTRTYFLRKSK